MYSYFLPGALYTLKYSETDFVLPDLKEVFSDIVFSVSRKNNKEAYISIILEHKSQPDDFTAVQVLLYVAYGYYKQYRSKRSLNPILPFVFYHGKQKWIFKPIEELFDELPEELKPYIPKFKALFVDLAQFSDEQLNELGDSLLTAVLLLGKYIFRTEELRNKIKLIFEKLNEASNSPQRNLIRPSIVYVLRNIEVNFILEIIEDLPPTIKTDIMTAYDALIEKGMQKGKEEGIREGMQKGIQKGIQKGMQKGKEVVLSKTVTNLHKKQFDIAQIADILEIPPKKVRELLKKAGIDR